MQVSKPVVREYSYRPRRVRTMVLLVPILSGIAVAAYFVIYGGVEMTVRVILAIVVILGLIMRPWMVMLLVRTFEHPRRVALTSDSLFHPVLNCFDQVAWTIPRQSLETRPVPFELASDEIEIPFDEITFARVDTLSRGTPVLLLGHASGTIWIPGYMLACDSDLEEIRAFVSNAIVDRQRTECPGRAERAGRSSRPQ